MTYINDYGFKAQIEHKIGSIQKLKDSMEPKQLQAFIDNMVAVENFGYKEKEFEKDFKTGATVQQQGVIVLQHILSSLWRIEDKLSILEKIEAKLK